MGVSSSMPASPPGQLSKQEALKYLLQVLVQVHARTSGEDDHFNASNANDADRVVFEYVLHHY